MFNPEEKIGEEKVMHNGMKAKIIGWEKYFDGHQKGHLYSIQFEDGTIVKRTYRSFVRCSVPNPNIKLKRRIINVEIGEIKINNDGMHVQLTEFKNKADITLKIIETGEIIEHVSYYENFDRSIVKTKLNNWQSNINKEFVSNKGEKCKIIKHVKKSTYIVKFENNVEKSFELKLLKKGKFSSVIKGIPTENKIGEWQDTNCGIKFKLVKKIENASKDTKAKYLIEFEDGEQSTLIYHPTTAKNVCHPKLNPITKKEDRVFHNFQIGHQSSKIVSNGKVLYKCECKKCGFQSILTPQQMMAHTC